MSKFENILISKQGAEGGFYIIPQGNGDTATPEATLLGLIDRNNGIPLPEWAEEDGLASADLKEHREWYTQRMGEEAYAALIMKPGVVLDVSDLKWDAVDEEGDLVEIEPDVSYRSERLAEMLGLDTSVEGFDAMQAELEIASTYASQPTDEATLAEAEGQSFEQDKKQQHG